MKYIIAILFCLCTCLHGKAQLSNGDLAPDFSFRDLNGNLQHLYSYLNSGKYVILDLSTTWCNPCWAYHSSHILNDFYNLHDLPGDQKAKVLFIEVDSTTTNDALYGLSGSTLGDWVSGTPYPIMNPSVLASLGETSLDSFIHQFHAFGLPSISVICPDKKTWHYTMGNPKADMPTVEGLEWIFNNKCNGYPTSMIDVQSKSAISLFPNPVDDFFYLETNNSIKEQFTIYNMLGQSLPTKFIEYVDERKVRIQSAGLLPGVYYLKHGLQALTFLKNE